MYFSKVNRGVTFTKAGFYTTGFVLLLGFVASGSGYNGLFLAVGFGLSVLTISGLLSERSMKHYELVALKEASATAHTPFTLPMLVRNTSDEWHVFGIENLAVLKLPRFRLMPNQIDAPISGRLLLLAPGESRETTARCRGLPRGLYKEFPVIQRTLYPFGLLAKFKVTRVPSAIAVAPALDEAAAEALTAEAALRIQGSPDDQEFHSHRPMTSQDSLRLIDWKKSAGLPTDNWSVKIYESPRRDYGIWLEVDWARLPVSPTEQAYERHLSLVRSACEVAKRLGKRLMLTTPCGGTAGDYEQAIRVLAEIPPFALRHTLSSIGDLRHAQAGWYLKLRLQGETFHWDSNPVTVERT